MMLLEVPLLYKIRNNGKPKTIAVIGAADKEISSVESCLEQYQMLLFDKDPKALSDIYDSLLANNHNINIEKCLALLMPVGKQISLFFLVLH
jgi:hypothetical protein